MTFDTNVMAILFVSNIAIAVLLHPRPSHRQFLALALFWLVAIIYEGNR